MKKLLVLTLLFVATISVNAQLYTRIDTLVVPAGTDSVFTFNGYAQAGVYIEIPFTNANAFDGVIGVGGTWTPYDTLYAEYQSMNNPITLNLTNFPDTVCRIERTVGLPAPYLKIKLTGNSLTAGLKFPIKICFDRF